jgi:hypothetical protein
VSACRVAAAAEGVISSRSLSRVELLPGDDEAEAEAKDNIERVMDWFPTS